MRIGFYAPLKPPDHPVPSGDRQMARALVAALERAGHSVGVYSRLRSFASDPATPIPGGEADREIDSIVSRWTDADRPHVLFTYHPYYKAPDLLGPSLARRCNLPYATVEASLSGRREQGPWETRQRLVAAAVAKAALNVCFTERDRDGLRGAAGPQSLLLLPPFIDATPFRRRSATKCGTAQLIVVAMMRHGDKLDSYRFLAGALALIQHLDWTLTVVGDGPARDAVAAAFAVVDPARLFWAGTLLPNGVRDHLCESDMMVWPGLNEAFGVCYLEAQASGLPVVAVRNAGTPSVIRHGETGVLTPADPAAYAAGLAELLTNTSCRTRMADAAFAFVHDERNLDGASKALNAALGALR